MTAVPQLDALAAALATWLPQQRWFGGKGSDVDAVEVLRQTLVSESPALAHALVTVRQGTREALYQLFVVARDDRPEALARAWIGDVDGRQVVDGAYDPAAAAVLLSLIGAGADVAGLRFRPIGDTVARALEHPLPSRVMGAEQSNTSIVYGDKMILKVFRQIRPGLNPDLEITRALAEASSAHVACPWGWIEADVDGVATTLAILQQFLASATEGWDLAKTSVRDLFAEADLHADEVGGDFAGESHRLGATVAEVHADLARTLPTGEWGPQQLAAEAGGMSARLLEAVEVVPELADLAPALQASFDRLAERSEPVVVQRIHGDLHLGQVLRTLEGWVVLDFEGEPAKTLEERRAPGPAVRDVAGMLRSFDYASRQMLPERPQDPAREAQWSYRATEWAQRNMSAFCEGYAQVAGADPREDDVLLRAYLIDKAVYEVVYEARNRPTWVGVPLAAVRRLAETG